MATMALVKPSTVVVATDLTPSSVPALVRARNHAAAVGARLVVCHIVPDSLRANPLFPNRNETDLLGVTEVMKLAGDRVNEELALLDIPVDTTSVVIEVGVPEDEIVALAEREHASLVVIGGKRRQGAAKFLGHVAERVVRYAHASVLVARDAPASARVLLATDFTDGSKPAHALAAELVDKAGVEVTALHTIQVPNSATAAAASALGGPWLSPPADVVQRLEELGMSALRALAAEHKFKNVEQAEGDAAEIIVERAKAIGAEMIVVGSRGRTGIARLVLGSVAEDVIRHSDCSVLVARSGTF